MDLPFFQGLLSEIEIYDSEALPASRSLILLHSCPFVRLVTANNATCRCAKDAMMTSKMARSTAHHRTF